MSGTERTTYLLGRYFDEVLSVDEAAELNEILAASDEAAAAFWKEAHTHARLRQWGEQDNGREIGRGDRVVTSPSRSQILPSVLAVVAVGVIVAVGTTAWLQSGAESSSGDAAVPLRAAVFQSLSDARWVTADTEHRVGDPIVAGQRLELSSGEAAITFVSGATVQLRGPAIFEAESPNSGFLMLGQVRATAETSESKGFSIRTRTARAIDQGTQFLARADSDGQSLFEVTSGAVDVEVPGRDGRQRLVRGNTLGVEPGLMPVLVKIERGDETPAFQFATIEPPSATDYADARHGRSRIHIAQGNLMVRNNFGSAPVEVLIDGRCQRQADAPRDSVFFADDMIGTLVLDLGRAVRVGKVNTYTWHQNGAVRENRLRAVQKFTLYGYAGETAPPLDETAGDAGWVRIARVDSDAFFEVDRPIERPAQQGCSIAAARGDLGTYRYLRFDVQPTLSEVHARKPPHHAFYGEIDVYAESAHEAP
jgi:hypothetical protein